MTLVFNQEAASYVYDSTFGAKKGDVFISPFIGRLDDTGVDGMSLIANIMEIYKQGDGHVEVLAASIRTLNHLLGCFKLGVDIVTAPYQSYAEWVNTGFLIPSADWKPSVLQNLRPIELDKTLSLKAKWDTYSNYNSPLFEVGLDKFSQDWNNLVKID
jgi:transaldolase